MFITKRSTKYQQRAGRGVVLIEALVSILILSIGVLGMMGMQAASIRYEQNSWARAAVSSLVADVSDRIRANPGSADTAYVYNVAYATERTAIDTNSSTFTVSPDCNTASCVPAEMATYDVAKWRQSLNTMIPGAVGMITGSRSGNYNITVAWFDRSRINSLGELESAPTCSATLVTAAARNCCPADLSAPAGVRCVNFAVIP
jgi:type IV pilus assembly protein PilV